MTKRFTFMQDTLVKADVFDNEEFVCCTLSVWVEQLVDLLNELHEENEELKKENEQLQKYVYHCPQTCRIILAYLNKCGSENVEAVNNAMDIDEYFDEEIDTLK